MIQSSIYQNGKVFTEIDFQIMIRKDRIRVLNQSIAKAYKMAGIDGPKGLGGLDYSGVTSSTPAAHIGLEDAIRMSERDKINLIILESELAKLRARKRNLIRILKSLDGIEEQIFYHRVIMKETQDVAAEKVGFSKRQLQRIEKQMKESCLIDEV